jgi:hypothetical protein
MNEAMQTLTRLERTLAVERDVLAARVALALHRVVAPLMPRYGEQLQQLAENIAFEAGYASKPGCAMPPLLAGDYALAHSFREAQHAHVFDEHSDEHSGEDIDDIFAAP